MIYKCHICNGIFSSEDCCWPKDSYYNFSNRCRYCSHDIYFKNIAVCYILNTYNLHFNEYPDELLEIEIIRAKIRWVMRGKETKYVTFKKENMITQVNNSTELRQALNENLHAILTKKRKLLVAKEVNNTLGKIIMDVKMELMQNALTGERKTISWFDRSQQEMKDQYGCGLRIKENRPLEIAS